MYRGGEWGCQHSKTYVFNRVFDYGWFIVCQGGETNPSGPAKNSNRPFGRFFVGISSILRVRKLGVENTHRFADFRTFQIIKTLLSA